MASKLARTFQTAKSSAKSFTHWLITKNIYQPIQESRRFSANMIPKNQYDKPFPPRLNIGHVILYNWEIIPLFSVTALAMAILVFAIYWTLDHKVDVVYTSRSRDNLSRTMDLMNPRSQKFITINQKYEPWPEMKSIIDKMLKEERKKLNAKTHCIYTMPTNN